MRYEDASEMGSFTADQAEAPSTLTARNDVDVILAGHYGPATGNTITGSGTISGSAGADMIAAGASITAIQGAGGTDTSFSAGKLQIAGEYGVLTIDAKGNYSYVRNQGSPDGVSDVFSYTLASRDGGSDVANLTINIGKTPLAIQANAVQVVPGPDGVVTLPDGVELSDIHVVGRNLVIDMPDGTQMIIVDGAVFVPQLVLGTVEVPATNLAALLVGSEPTPAAGPPQSSGGNFAVPPPPLDPGVPLGDLIPPTALFYTPPEFRDVANAVDEDDDNPVLITDLTPSVSGGDVVVDEDDLSDGSDTTKESLTVAGTFTLIAPDGVDDLTVGSVLVIIDGVFQAGASTVTPLGNTLTFTGYNAATGVVSYTYTLLDNESHASGAGENSLFENFAVTLTDVDGDVDTDTLSVNIIDDVPTARPDTDSIAAGGFGPATGNVITDAAAGDAGDSDTNAADTLGADGASLTSVSGAGGSDSTFTAGLLQVNGTYGVLTIDAGGNYSYVRNAGTPGGVNDVFNYTLTDGDGDTSTSTLTISIGDATPQTGQNPTALLDDDAQPNGISGGVGDDVDAANLSGNLAASGGDGPLSYDLLLTGAPAGFTYVDGASGSVLVQQGGVTVLTITVNAATGAYTVTQNAPIDHPAGSDENNVAFTINYRVSDQDGDTADGTLSINVDDDTPSIGRADVSLPTLTVDETNLAANATGNFSTVFNGQYGADGPGATSYAVSVVNGTDSGLVDVATGQSIFLFNNAGVVEGRVGGVGGAVAFTVSVNSATGVVALDQIRALDHPDVSNPDDSVSPGATSIQLTASIVDGDGDPASRTVNIGAQLVFKDDGPSVTPGAVQPTLVVDESNLTINNTLSFGDAFTAAFGADGPAGSGSIGYALGINAGATGLVDTATGLAVVLSLEGGMVVGRAGPGGSIVFTVGINASGDVTLDQERAVRHPDTTNPDDSISLATDDLITITATATDADGDTASVTIGIGRNLQLEDDGPSAVNDVDTIVGGLGPATGNVITGVDFGGGDANATDGSADAPGADGGSITAVTSNNVPANVDTDASANFLIAGQYGVLTLNANGNYSYLRNEGSPGGVSDVFTYTLTDGDGDPVTATLTIGIDDNFPSAGDVNVQLDDDVLGGNPGGTGDDANAVNVSGNLPGSGGDGALTWDLLLTGAPAGFSYVDGPAGAVHVLQGATHVVTITIVPATGAYTVTQIAPIDHPDGLQENNVQFTVNYRVTDADGDFADGTIDIDVDDDTPVATATLLTGTVDEDGVLEGAADSGPGDGIAGGTGDVAGEVTVVNGSVATLFSAGADVPLTYSLLTNTAGLPALTSGGVTVTYAVVGNTLTASAGVGNTVFTFQLLANGNYTFTLVDQLDHASGNNENDLSIALGSIISATDNDGDSVTANANGLVITVDDDTPTLGTIQDGEANNNPAAAPTVGTLHFEVGADEPASVTNITVSSLAGITSGGDNLVTAYAGNVLTAYADVDGSGTVNAGDTVVFTLTVNPNAGTSGQYVFDLVAAFDPTVTDTPIGGSSSFGAGPTGFQILQGAAAQDLAVVSGYHIGGSFNEATWLATGSAGPGGNFGSAGVNGSTSGWGIDNNNFDGTDEFFVWDFGSQATRDPDGAGPFVPPVQGPDVAGDPPEVQMPNISFATFEFIHYSSGPGAAGDDINYVVHFTDGTFASGAIPDVNIDGALWTFTAPAGKFIADIEMYSGTGGQDLAAGKVDLVSVGVQTSNLTEDMDFTVTLSDFDGDTVSGTFSMNVADGNVPSTPEAAVVPAMAADDFSAMSLKSSDTHQQQQHKTAANNNNVMIAALAAGVAAAPAAAHSPALDSAAPATVAGMLAEIDGSVVASDVDVSRSALGNETNEAVSDESSGASSRASNSGEEPAGGHSLTAGNDLSPATQPVDLLEATDAPASSGAASIIAPMVSMPSAEALIAASLEGGAPEGSQANAVVGKVVVDALEGGGAEASVDALLEALPAHGLGGNAAVEALASQPDAAVSAWDTGHLGGFTAGQNFTMEAMALHHDAVQPVANG